MKPNPASAWMIIPTYFPVVGGAQVQAQHLSEALADNGWEVTVITRQHSWAHPDGLPPFETRDGIQVRRLSSRGRSKLGTLRFMNSGLWYFLRSERRGLYHAHDTGAAGWLAVIASRLFGGRCLIKLRTGRVAYEQSLRSTLARWQFVALLRGADRIIVVNSEVQDYLTKLGIPAERVKWIPNGVDTTHFSPATAAQKRQARARLGLRDEQRVVLYVGRLEYFKGVDVLIQGWKGLREAHRRNSRLLIVGDGPERESLGQMVEENELTSSVVFTGELQSVQEVYQAADLFVLPSRTEGLSNALLEAMACGLPVVVSNVGGAIDLVQEGLSGYFFESEDTQGLAARLEALLSIPGAWGSFGSVGRASVLANASLTVTLQQMERVYQELAQSIETNQGRLMRRQKTGDRLSNQPADREQGRV